MRIALARIDDRLIHGQVTVGWCQRLEPDRLVLANDEIAADPWQRRIYASAVPPEIAVSILGVAAAAAVCAPGPDDGDETALLLVERPADMLALCRLGVVPGTVNLGGMHYRQGKHEMLDFLYVDTGDVAALRELLRRGVALSARQLPGARETVVDERMLDAVEARL